MLLKELKLIETDRNPLQQSLSALGVNLRDPGLSNRTTSSTKDVSPKLLPIIRKDVITDSQNLSETEYKKLFPDGEAVEQGIKNFISLREIIAKMESDFIRGISEFPETAQLARLVGDGGVKGWMAVLHRDANLMAAQHKVKISQVIDENRDRLEEAIMRVTTAETFVQSRVEFMKRLIQSKRTPQETLVEAIEIFFGLIWTLTDNINDVIKFIERLRPKKEA